MPLTIFSGSDNRAHLQVRPVIFKSFDRLAAVWFSARFSAIAPNGLLLIAKATDGKTIFLIVDVAVYAGIEVVQVAVVRGGDAIALCSAPETRVAAESGEPTVVVASGNGRKVCRIVGGRGVANRANISAAFPARGGGQRLSYLTAATTALKI